MHWAKATSRVFEPAARARFMSRWATGMIAAGSLCLGAPQQPVAAERSVINQYCVGCHNAKLKTAGLALDTLSAEGVGPAPGNLGEGGSEAGWPLYAADRASTAE